MNNFHEVLISADRAYVTRRCNESPWGTEEVFNELIYDWLDDMATPSGWDHDIYDSKTCVVYIEDRRVAMLFKLAWTL